MNVNFTSKKVLPNLRVFFVNKDKKNLNYHNISSDLELKQNIINSLSRRYFTGHLDRICHIDTAGNKGPQHTVFIGVGDETKLEASNFHNFGGLLFSYIENLQYKEINLEVGDLKKIKLS